MQKVIRYRKGSKRSWVYYLAMGNFYLFSYLFKLYHSGVFHRRMYSKGSKLTKGAFCIELVALQVYVLSKQAFKRDIYLNQPLKFIYK